MATTRPAKVKTAVGNEFFFHHLAGREEISRPFRFEVSLLSDNDRIELGDLLGTPMTVTMGLDAVAERHFHGIVHRAAYAGTDGAHARYRVGLVPWLWFLTQTEDCRIFQEQTAVDIVKIIFGKYRIAELEDRLTGTYALREYCVQYRESDFDFVSRLLESEGISYYFEHEEDRHVLVLADGDDAYGTSEGYEHVPYFPRDDQARRERDHVYDWLVAGEVRSGGYSHTSFDFKKPTADLEVRAERPMSHALAEGEVYDYPGPHVTLDHGDAIARRRLEEVVAQSHRVQGEGTVAGLVSGHRFSLLRYPREDQNREYLILSVEHEIRGEAGRSGSSGGDEGADGEVYVCRFTAMPSDRPFRPARTTPRPLMHGPQTAIVTGGHRDEIRADEHGRVKVRFHWDREGRPDEHSSCWMRVAQIWAGKRWGATYIPRVGQEVVVDFLSGDPDQPIIIGSVYNAEQMPPYLGDGLDSRHKSNPRISGIKSNSTPGGKGYNELRFDDTKGQEQVFLHAQGSLDVRVQGSHRHTVGGSYHLGIGSEDADGDKTGDLKIGVAGNLHMHGEGYAVFQVGGDLDFHVEGNVSRVVGGYRREDIAEDWAVSADSIVFEAASSIGFRVGGSFVSIDRHGVTVSGTLVKINCSDAVPPDALPTIVTLDPDPPADAAGSVSGLPSNRIGPGGGGGP